MDVDVVGPGVSVPVTVFAEVDTPRDQGSIDLARSADGGRTWTVGTLAPATSTHRYHYVILLHDEEALYAFLGRISVAADRSREGDVDGFPVELVALRSTDGGATWADLPVSADVPANGRGVVVAGKPVRHGGMWLMPYFQRAGSGVLRSSDLRTWRPGGLAVPPRGIGVEEPQVVSIGRADVRAMRKGSSRWEQIHTHPGGPAVWKVSVDSAGLARLFRDGKDTGVTWMVQDSREQPHAAHCSDGSAPVEWSLVTASLGH